MANEVRGVVAIPAGYFFKMAQHDYSDWRDALPREFYQNSIDAGATRIDVAIHRDELKISVADDGCGMSREVLVDKLLVLGGSHKAEGSVGAFGKAKELLFFSWLRYRIETRNLVCDGSSAEYTISERDQFVNGTRCEIWLDPSRQDEYRSLSRTFRRVAQKMQTKTKIWIDDELVPCEARRGTPVRTIEDIGTVYQIKSRESAHLMCRVDGIFMFDLYIGDGKGELILEIERSSVDVLTSNRDGLKWEARSKVSQVIEDLMVNPKSALKNQPPSLRKILQGEGAVRVVNPYKVAAVVEAASQGVDKVAALLADDVFERASGLFKERVRGMREVISDKEALAKYAKMIGYKPDFVLDYPPKKETEVKRFMKTGRAALLAKLWTETIRQVLMDNGVYLEFTAGFTFDDEAEASISTSSDDGVVISLNPQKVKRLAPRYVLMDKLRMDACHEIAHLAVKEHNENFVLKLHQLMEGSAKSRAQYVYIGMLKADAEVLIEALIEA